jgi:hypothetical protein
VGSLLIVVLTGLLVMWLRKRRDHVDDDQSSVHSE